MKKFSKTAIEALISKIEDAGLNQSAESLSKDLEGTDHLIEENTTVAYYHGWLNCLQSQKLLNSTTASL